MPSVQGVILDIDGTLVDSNDAHARAWVRAFGDEGLDVPFERVRSLVGMGGDQLVPEVLGIGQDSARYARVKEGWKTHFVAEELARVRSQPGTRELVAGLRSRGLKVIIGTSADESLVQGLLERAELADADLPFTTASDVEASKPEPDIILAAVERLALAPDEVLMVGDTPFDVQAAQKAGVRTVFLTCGGDTRHEGAYAVYRDPADLARHLDDL
ncbi:HAD family hydrolase [Deinococcus peraridilitoris]|uniref:Haloacid dehalogenase superfamily enzyme, subfamily IA n=1 Tax=Deinococcus peraridilitoris (strain DSM 19664 / LMG 22246 / CIP 109416 / KR-200) TaxID=937777 RepID=L0A7B6_DEIPD|nr:HAD family hydrolase [Deinococcus peraridilitoris]AFZ68950.1 haloacid dehalogenase superfamily enzyme, subfamily IA [Deinococcus peraridilitoris DSM 19664]